jgi:alpha-mannosidase
VHDDTDLVELRIARWVRERLVPAVHRRRTPLEVTAWAAPGEPVPFAEAVRQTYAPLPPGSAWGRPWGTVWLHVTGTAPDPEPGTVAEVLVDLGFTDAQPGFQAEGLVHAPDGRVLHGLEPRRRHVRVEGGTVDLYVEAAANPDLTGDWHFAPTPYGDPATAGDDPLYRLGAVEAALRDTTVWELVQDVWTLRGLHRELPRDTPRRAEVLRALERAVDLTDPEDVAGTAADARAALAGVLASPAHASAHRVHAVGHAHLDSAWLWPVRETGRKVARTVANVLALMDADEGLVFAMSSAQQYAWLADQHPELFARLRERVAQGRFVPVGGMWVEADTNLPGGEALARQFVVGGAWFREHLGVECPEVWLPDSFGYSAALPQLARAAGARWFLTQKLSWNETNLMPHHTFHWEGVDGTRIFTHFPPVDTYGAELSGAELARASRGFAEKGRANTSLVPFGWSDGGGGPTREMLAAAARTADLEGSPRVAVTTPAAFFAAAQEEYAEPPVWSGELYLEFHRGTYTSQARTKRGNRRCEALLREAELWATTATVRTGAPYPAEALRRCWETVLLQQFHDILPGTSIAWVHQEAERRYAEVAAELEGLISAALSRLCAPTSARTLPGTHEANAGPYAVGGVPGLGCGPAEPPLPVRVERDGEQTVLDDGLVRARVDGAGRITSLVRDGREVVPPGDPVNVLRLHRDTPARWDAWDVDEHHRRSTVEPAGTATATATGVEVAYAFGSSTARQTITLDRGAVRITTEVDWHERQKLLKLAVPLDLHADRATSEIQFGHVHRPVHANTSWDVARFETCANRWVHVGEPGFGVAIANDAVHGHDTTRTTRTDGGTTTMVRLSLLRAPLFPDPSADQGAHRSTITIRPGADVPAAVADGYALHLPPRPAPGPVAPLLTVDHPGVVVEAVKLAEDGSGDVVVRLYEAFGGRAAARVSAAFDHTGVVETDLHERPLPAPVALDGDRLALRPFRIATLRFARP